MAKNDGLLVLIGQLPEELQEEGSTGRDLIDNIIYEAKKEERGRIVNIITKCKTDWFDNKDDQVDWVQEASFSIEDWQALKG